MKTRAARPSTIGRLRGAQVRSASSLIRSKRCLMERRSCHAHEYGERDVGLSRMIPGHIAHVGARRYLIFAASPKSGDGGGPVSCRVAVKVASTSANRGLPRCSGGAHEIVIRAESRKPAEPKSRDTPAHAE